MSIITILKDHWTAVTLIKPRKCVEIRQLQMIYIYVYINHLLFEKVNGCSNETSYCGKYLATVFPSPPKMLHLLKVICRVNLVLVLFAPFTKFNLKAATAMIDFFSLNTQIMGNKQNLGIICNFSKMGKGILSSELQQKLLYWESLQVQTQEFFIATRWCQIL